MSELNRRPIKARSVSIFQNLASFLAKTNISPNQISVASIFFSCFVPISFLVLHQNIWAYMLAALGIQLRLICNLLDGMVAVEGGKKSVLGDIYNEFPDRISDSIILLGFALPEIAGPRIAALAWASCFFAAITAYTRVLGAAVGTKHFYIGPMAKQQRMAIITICLIFIPFLGKWISSLQVTEIALWIICGGCVITSARRLGAMVLALKQK